MLYVISATETIKKSYLAYFLNSVLNSIDYCLFEDYNDQYPFHFKMQFRDISYDYKENSDITYPEGGDYSQFLKTYRDRKTETLVITGSFSRAFVEMINNDVKDVNIINIIRNPSVTYLIDSLTEDKHGPYDSELKIKSLKRRYISSLLNSITLKNIDSVKTITFENIIKDQQIENIKAPQIYKNYNNWITAAEKIKLTFNLKLTQNDIKDFNQIFSSLADNLTNTNYDLSDVLLENLPRNIFDMLDYKPVTLEQIDGHSF